MKVQDLAYQVAERTMELLEQVQHYAIPDQTRKDIKARILDELGDLINKSSK